MSIVIDSSITLAWYFEDEVAQASDAVLHDVRKGGAVVPPLWRFEVANGLQTAVRRKRIDATFRDESLADLDVLPIAVDTDSAIHAWTTSVALADRHGLTIYDAAYLEVAQRRRLPLATLDAALIRAGRAERLAVIGS